MSYRKLPQLDHSERFLLFVVNNPNHHQPARLNRMKDQLHRYPGLILIGIGLLLLGCGIYGLTQPEEFRAQSRIKMPTSDYSGFADNLADAQERGEQALKYYAEEIKFITSDAILSNVVSQLNFAIANRTEPKAPKSIRALRNQINAKAVHNTMLVNIYVTDISADDAAQIANLVAATYQQWWRARGQSLVKQGIVELEKQLAIQQQKVRSIETELQRLKVELNLPSPEPTKEELRSNYPTIYDTEPRLEEERDVERLLTRKINIEKADLSSNRADRIEIVEKATPPRSPLRRKKALSTILIASGLLCCGWGIMIVRDPRPLSNEV